MTTFPPESPCPKCGTVLPTFSTRPAMGNDATEADKKAARKAICRGADPGQAIPKCRCFQDGLKAILERPNCNGACEDAVDFVAKAIAAEREACARIAQEMFGEPVIARAIRERFDEARHGK